MGRHKGVLIGPPIPFDPEVDKLVQEVKAEMMLDGTRYVETGTKYKIYSKNGKVIKPEFGFILSSMCKSEPEKEVLDDGIQFRGVPGKQSALPEIIKGKGFSFKYFSGGTE